MAGETKDRPSKNRRKKEKDEDRATTKDESSEEQTAKPSEKTDETDSQGKAPCPVVGVGASAGGLEAIQGLFEHVPADVKAAFVVIQHRATDRTSVMRSLIEKHTQLAVKDIEDGVEIEPGTIYLAPAERDVSIQDGHLFTVEPPPHVGLHLPIDSFLRSLAADGAERAICIILSGTGSDGTLGLKEVKAAGGMAMAQDETQAKYDSMPRNAIDTGMVDFILPVEKMGEQLTRYLANPFLAKPRPIREEKDLEGLLQKIFVLIRVNTGHDFSHYKRNTIHRRVARRMAVHQIEHIEDYVGLLQEHPEEVGALAKELLITVTNFFRDPEAFDALRDKAIAPLVRERRPNGVVRVWVAGCATGEEAYSIAILLYEEISRSEKHFNVQIFATDIDEDSVETARHGQYPKSIAGNVSPERLKRFFTEENDHYKVRSSIREMLVFAGHNLVKDAPFSHLDLVCCRNVLIYMDSTLQKKIIPMFHYTLNPDGALFLGESESIGSFSDLFIPLDSRHKIFKRKAVDTGFEPQIDAEFLHQAQPERAETVKKPGPKVSEIAQRVILRDYSMPCVVVDENHQIVYFSGNVNRFLVQPGGRPTLNILHMARPEIHYKLSLLLKRAFHGDRVAMEKNIQVRVNDHFVDLDLIVRPVAEAVAGENLMLVVFQVKHKEGKPGEREVAPVDLPEQEKDARIRELEGDLQSTKECLQTTIEELETSNEELKSSNEELQSTNEELQSTNEELDTSREELQSTNEELRTVNAEHQQKIEELSKAYDDLSNLLKATGPAVLYLTPDLKIRRFTPAARTLFRLIARDVGRPLEDIATSLKDSRLIEDVRTVLDMLTPIEREVGVVEDERTCYQMRIVPYRTAENVIDGAVVSFVDITEYKDAVRASEEARDFAEATVETVRQPLLVLCEGLKVENANPAFYRLFQVRPEDTVGRLVYDLGDRQWNLPELRELLEKIVPENKKFEGYKVSHEFPQIGRRTFLLDARQTMLKGRATGRILLAFQDITGQKEGQ